jgi:hypothetical protein
VTRPFGSPQSHPQLTRHSLRAHPECKRDHPTHPDTAPHECAWCFDQTRNAVGKRPRVVMEDLPRTIDLRSSASRRSRLEHPLAYHGLPWHSSPDSPSRATIARGDGLHGQHEFVVFRASIVIVIGRALRSTVIGGWICICPFDEGRRGSQFLLGRLALGPKQAGSAAGLETDPHTRLSTQTSYNTQGWLLCRRWPTRDHALATHGKERGLWKPAPDI